MRVEQFNKRSWRCWRGALAFLLGLLFLAIVLPNAGRIAIDQSTTQPTPHIVDRVQQSLAPVSLVIVALTCICVSIWRRWDFEIVGWALLAICLGLSFLK